MVDDFVDAVDCAAYYAQDSFVDLAVGEESLQCRDYFDDEYCDVQGNRVSPYSELHAKYRIDQWIRPIQIYTFNFECPIELIESENHYCLRGKEGEECCTNDFETFSKRFSKGCVENCPYVSDTK